MPQKIAVAIIHGMGAQDPRFAEPMIEELENRFAALLPKTVEHPQSQLEIMPIYWAPALQLAQNRLWRKVNRKGDLDFVRLRKFLINFLADAIAYQPSPSDRSVYDAIHLKVAKCLNVLARDTDPTAPLCVIAHSLGSVIASNYFYDLSAPASRSLVANTVRAKMDNTPLENGETLTLFYTMGCPLALWSLRYEDFGEPISVPSEKLNNHHPALTGEWINFYDSDDIIGYPLRPVSDAYRTAVKKDKQVNVGGLLSSWNPMAHSEYWTDNDVTTPIAKGLAKAWKAINT